MQGDAVALAVADDGPAAVGANAVDILEDRPGVGDGFGDGVADAAVGVEVDQRPGPADLVRIDDEAAAVAVLVVEHGELEVLELLPVALLVRRTAS